MQNWNDGKAQEYKDRKLYDISRSVLKKSHAKTEPAAQEDYTVNDEVKESAVVLFATETCPNCKLAGQWLDKAGIPYVKKYVSQNEEEAKALGLKQAPTLVVPAGSEVELFSGIANIKKYIDSVKAQAAG